MGKRWLCMLLLLALMAGAAIPAYGAEGLEAPPAEETMEEAPVPEEVPPAEEAPPMEDALPAKEVAVTDKPEPAAAQGVTLTIEGPTEGILWYVWYGLDDTQYSTSKSGTSYSYLETPSSPSYTQVWTEKTDQIRRQVTVAPDSKMWVFLSDAVYDITVTGGVITENSLDTFTLGREVYVQCPDSGSVTLHIARTDGYVPERIPFTFYNETTDRVVGGGSTGDYAYPDGDTVTTGGNFEVWAAPGYEIQVLEGGSVTKVCAPSGPAAQSVPAGTMSYVLHVDLGAERFVIAAVKQGETFTPPAEGEEPSKPTETPLPEGVIFTDVPEGIWYENAVMTAYEKGIVKGVTAHTFDPDGVTTRGQAVTMLYRAMGSPAANGVFSDTKGEVASAAGWAAAKGVTTGATATAFAPNAYVTREQLVTMLYRLSGSPGMNTDEALRQYADGASVQSYARDAVVWALSTGLLNGYTDMTIRPAGYATRAEVCALIMRYLGM